MFVLIHLIWHVLREAGRGAEKDVELNKNQLKKRKKIDMFIGSTSNNAYFASQTFIK